MFHHNRTFSTLTISSHVWQKLFVPLPSCSSHPSKAPNITSLLIDLNPLFQLKPEDLPAFVADQVFLQTTLKKLDLLCAWVDRSHLPVLLPLCLHPIANVQVRAILTILTLQEDVFPTSLLSILNEDLSEKAHFILMRQLSMLFPARWCRSYGESQSDFAGNRNQIITYLMKMMKHPSVSRRVQAMVILADGRITESMPLISESLRDQTSLHCTDWDDIPDQWDLVPDPEYPWRMPVQKLARDALAEIDTAHALESGWIEFEQLISDFLNPDLLIEVMESIQTAPGRYPKSEAHLKNQSVARPEIHFLLQVIQDQQNLKLALALLPEETWLPYLQNSTPFLLPRLISHLEARHQVCPLSIQFCHGLLASPVSVFQGLGLWLMTFHKWPEAKFMALRWLVETDLKKQAWAIRVLGCFPGSETTSALLKQLHPSAPVENQHTACESLIRLQDKSCLLPLLKLITTEGQCLDISWKNGFGEGFSPQLKVLEELGDASWLDEILSCLPGDVKDSDGYYSLPEAMCQLIQKWQVISDHVLLKTACANLFNSLENFSEENRRTSLLEFLSHCAGRSLADQLLPELINYRKGLKRYLSRILKREDIPFLEPLLCPENRLVSELSQSLSQSGLPEVRPVLEKALKSHRWPLSLAKRLYKTLSRIKPSATDSGDN